MNFSDSNSPAGLSLGQKVLIGLVVGALLGAVSAYATHHACRLAMRQGMPVRRVGGP